MMDAPAFDATRFVRLALRSIVFCFSIILISLMIVKPAQASGTVSGTFLLGANYTLRDYPQYSDYLCYGSSITEAQSCELAKVSALPDFCGAQLNDAGAFYDFVDTFTITFKRWSYIWGTNIPVFCGSSQDYRFGVSKICPEHAHASGTTCICNDPTWTDPLKYEPDSSQTKCIPDKYTIALSGLGGDVMPTKTRAAYAQVTTSTGSPKSGAQVTLILTVKPDNGDPILASNVGSVSPNGGSTDSYGKLSFVFTAPPEGGTHTIDAFCTGCTNYAEGTIKVPGCSVPALTAPPFNDACAEVLENLSSTQAQKDAACGALTDKLKTGMACFRDKLSGLSPAIPLKITSDIRDVAYQAHLREIWDRMQALVQLEGDPVKRAACADRRAEIAAEKGCDNAGRCTSCYSESATQRSHCLKGRPANPSPNDAQHTQGNAFDVSEDYTITPLQDVLEARNPPQTISKFLDAPTNCNLIWGGTFITNYDPVHFYAP
jgi:hypothetical protein